MNGILELIELAWFFTVDEVDVELQFQLRQLTRYLRIYGRRAFATDKEGCSFFYQELLVHAQL